MLEPLAVIGAIPWPHTLVIIVLVCLIAALDGQ